MILHDRQPACGECGEMATRRCAVCKVPACDAHDGTEHEGSVCGAGWEPIPHRPRWGDTDALGLTLKAWVARCGTERVTQAIEEASDRDLATALGNLCVAQRDRDGFDGRVLDLMREIEDRLWRANGGALTREESQRVDDEMELRDWEGKPRWNELAERYRERYGRDPHLSDCACPECLPRGAR